MTNILTNSAALKSLYHLQRNEGRATEATERLASGKRLNKAGDDAAAERHMIGAIEIEETLNAPSGPPFPMKPAFEMYGEFLVEKGRYDEAARQFNKVLERAPNRTKSIQGLEWALSNME